jgi:hypothetical protein
MSLCLPRGDTRTDPSSLSMGVKRLSEFFPPFLLFFSLRSVGNIKEFCIHYELR